MDPELSGLYPDLSRREAHSRTLFDSSGTGRALQALLIPELVVRTAARRAGWPGTLDPRRYFSAVPAIVGELRRLIVGEIVEVPAWVSLVGRDVPGEFRLTTPLGALSRAPADIPLGPASVAQPGLLLTLTYPLSLELDATLSEKAPPRVFTAQRDFQRRIDHLRLAVLLALESSDPSALQVGSREISSPLNPNALSWPFSAPPFSLPLKEGDAALVKYWCEMIAWHHHPSIELAGRRALSAATRGREPEDGLVDAVIGLENLVGGSGRPPARTFDAAVAALVTDEPAGREAISERAKVLYSARSDIVHGRRELDLLEAERLRSEGVRTLLTGLRRLFGDLRPLIADSRRARTLLRRPTK